MAVLLTVPGRSGSLSSPRQQFSSVVIEKEANQSSDTRVLLAPVTLW